MSSHGYQHIGPYAAVLSGRATVRSPVAKVGAQGRYRTFKRCGSKTPQPPKSLNMTTVSPYVPKGDRAALHEDECRTFAGRRYLLVRLIVDAL